ncbi:MAG: phosphate ABC transporter substrate-binding protein [SAR202 cluster bacterium Casp-Chloro-G4]|nr:PstS family phosphate ABC transporter substrate-binding protein [Chloroflexota bacterium]MDA1227666.1 PstS family phosphate ABC transporter substrate-binding protein [Chloroflexota bacterium]PKB61891.1 MAG: phosphate ABC transporter substrate-binding protein [SAR202 cluster bacterium Casp-Chloro-G4]
MLISLIGRIFKNPSSRLGTATLLVLILSAGMACGGSTGTGAGDGTGQPSSGSGVSGQIEIDGSSTVFPITEAVAEEFRNSHPNVQVNVGVSGTGGGFKRFIEGQIDINDASRPIKPSESGTAAENGVEYLELEVAIDGLAVMVSPQNDFVECLTVEQLKTIWEPGSSVKTWNDVDPTWPNNGLNLYGPGTDSGTFDYFTEVVMGEAQASRPDYSASEDDNVLVQGIGGDRNALGYFGYAYYIENVDKLKIVAIDAGAGCVKPTAETIENGKYQPLSRPLLIYINKASLEKPDVNAFLRFYMENGAELAEEVGYIRLSEQEYKNNIALLQ